MAKKTTSATQKARYKQYGIQNKYSKNREVKLKRHIENNPNDNLAISCMQRNINGFNYRRKKPLGLHKEIKSIKLAQQVLTTSCKSFSTAMFEATRTIKN